MHKAKNLQEIRLMITRHKRFDKLFMVIGVLALMVAVLTFVALFAHMLIDGMPRLTWGFFISFPSRHPEIAGILSAWVGTILVMLVTAATAVPIGIGAGVYLEEYAPKNIITEIIEINITNLAGVPSIVYGLLALGMFVYQLGFGQSILSAGLALALLILPVVIVATREAIRAIPVGIREGAYALGASKWQTVSDHLLPYSAAGIAFLPPSPIKGEFPFISFEWLTAPFTVMPIQMFNWVSRPQEEFQINAAAAGLVLVVMTLTMNALAIYIRYHMRKKIKW
jgi:phosphate transport system permease protein